LPSKFDSVRLKNTICLLVVTLAVSFQLSAQSASAALRLAPFLEYEAGAGDDITAVMATFGLDLAACNRQQFIKLNKLTKTSRLQVGKVYKLPIQVVQYNGKSIRSTLGIDDIETAKRIDRFNKSAQRNKLRKDNFIESRNLWVPWHEVNCNEEVQVLAASTGTTTPAKPAAPANTDPSVAKVFGGEMGTGAGKHHYSIFGPTYAHTPVISNRLRGKVFYLISGHGGPDTGAQGKRAGATLCEDEYAYDVTLRLLRFLLSHGAIAYMIVRDNDGIRDAAYFKCDYDEKLLGEKAIPRDQKLRLEQRTDLINQLTIAHNKKGHTDQTVVEIHVDSRSVSAETDVFFYFRPGSELSQDLALHIHEIFIEKYRTKQGRRYTGTVSGRDLWTLRETSTAKAVYIELGNIRNDWDQQRLVLKNNRQAVANWVGQALLK
jgi:N-acetylmuramoyl-L-alanine amidase